jgi:hypothetical protein
VLIREIVGWFYYESCFNGARCSGERELVPETCTIHVSHTCADALWKTALVPSPKFWRLASFFVFHETAAATAATNRKRSARLQCSRRREKKSSATTTRDTHTHTHTHNTSTTVKATQPREFTIMASSSDNDELKQQQLSLLLTPPTPDAEAAYFAKLTAAGTPGHGGGCTR